MDINEFIKKNYPKVEFVPLTFEQKKTNSIAFVISDNKFVIGYVSQDGTLCKLITPLDLSTVDNPTVVSIIKKIPTALYFTQKDKDNVIKLLESQTVIQKTDNQVLEELQNSYQKQFDTLIKTKDDEKIESILLVKKECSEEMENIIKEYSQKLEKCENNILENSKNYEAKFQDYKDKMDTYIKSLLDKNNNDNLVQILKETVKKLEDENAILESQITTLKQNIQGSDTKKTISLLEQELKKVKDEFTGQSLKDKVTLEFYKNCIEKVINEKGQIVNQIKQYKKQWIDWTTKNCNSGDIYAAEKEQLREELKTIKNSINDLIKNKDSYINSLKVSDKEKNDIIKNLKKNIEDIKLELNKSCTDQITTLISQNENLKKLLEQKNKQIKDLLTQLESIKKNLNENAKINPIIEIDYTDCKDTFDKFVMINNTFYRKLDIINSLQNIINDKSGALASLHPRFQSSIKKKFIKLSKSIKDIIEQMNLSKYTTSPMLHLFKNPNTMKDIPVEFCKELFDLSVFWNNNNDIFQSQDIELTNIYEDLSGAVRVYVKVKPYTNKGTVSIKENQYNKNITIDCTGVQYVNRKDTYEDFYDIYNDTFNNKETYSGIKDSSNIFDLKITDYSPKSIHNSFKQVAQGYSVVLSGYGLSGSGKTHTLLGTNGVPGLLHYGLSNLPNVKGIKLKYLFEQYINVFVPTLNIIRGSIINLINKFPNLKSPYTKDERIEFKEYLGNQIDINNINVNIIGKLINLIDAYRKSKKRIKKTPNNPESSRSHLFLTFEVSFTSGYTGYITILDCAGRESPIDLFNMYIDTTKKVSLVTILGPSGGPKEVEKYLKEKYIGQSKEIYEMLNESFYINETTNHLVYYFNNKNFKYTMIRKNTINEYSISKYFVDPENEKKKLSDTNYCLTVNILEFLDGLGSNVLISDDYKPTKFVTVTCIRQDPEYCNQIFSTLDFASSIKST